MRNLVNRAVMVAAIAGLSIAVSACGDGNEAANEAAPNAADANLMFEEPANDASAMESVANIAEPAPVTNTADIASNETEALGETSGGDTGGNTVESNVAGM